ncbi:MAG: xylulokinase [Turicibacter sp.]|nr:xylulokinase [Turicibacter sp.]
MKYVLGVDLGTSAVKVILVNQLGEIKGEATRPYPLSHPAPGYSEQNAEDWVTGTIESIKEIMDSGVVNAADIEGLSFSGQMHGLVLVDEAGTPLRPAILWNDVRTTAQCQKIKEVMGEELTALVKNPALEGFTLPKILWVQEHEPETFAKATQFLLPKDYLSYRLTGARMMEFSDASGTLLFDLTTNTWSQTACDKLGLDISICPPLCGSDDQVGTILPDIAAATGLSTETKVFAGGADNAAGALGAGNVSDGIGVCSIGTSGVFSAFEATGNQDFGLKLQYHSHAKPNSYYLMGVTLAAGNSLNWFKETFAKDKSFADMLANVGSIVPGSNGLIFTPYIVGERFPHADAQIRGSFIGMSGTHGFDHFARAVLEGITFSLRDALELMRTAGNKQINKIISIGGGAKNEDWLQIQADVFNATVIKLTSEQGPALGSAIIAAMGCKWFDSYEACIETFIGYEKEFTPIPENVALYEAAYQVYTQVYAATKSLNEQLAPLRDVKKSVVNKISTDLEVEVSEKESA